MGHCHRFRRICNKITGHKRIFHTNVSHGDSVTHCNGRKYNRGSPCHCHTHLHCIHDLIQIHVSWNNLIVGADNTDQWTVKLFFRVS